MRGLPGAVYFPGPQLTRPSPMASPALPALLRLLRTAPLPCELPRPMPSQQSPSTFRPPLPSYSRSKFQAALCCWCSAFACDSCSGETMYRLHCDY
ncbi:hypothetical protein BRADI_1g76012v3 [Brachypodium distachyon]|uniref:Uncharacterized protein n=1 Tax=Brachypodium distachyon TaxID=15368 RepID=A0A2K2DVE9_BRADI|nr:hypothetical protein BRADI_1g76012v3 [Brachypodium distachyon]